MAKRCINLDWLEVYAMEHSDKFPLNADYYRSQGYHVIEREYGTRVYAEMFTIEDEHGLPFVEVRRNPLSSTAHDGGLFPPESCHLRLTNYACYAPYPVGDLRAFMVRHGYDLVKIFRIDICLDFIQFDHGDDPARFVRRYIDGRYSKINQGNISAHGKDTWQQRKFNSLSWGAKKSMVSTKLYNKSLELSEVKDKPYIRYAWYRSGLIENPITCTSRDAQGNVYKPDVWRVEFSIQSSAKRWYVIEDCNRHKKLNVYMPHTLECYDSREKLLVAFASLSRHYFHFKKYDEGKRKDRCEDKVLFDFKPSDMVYKLTGNVSSRPADSKLQRLRAYLLRYKQGLIDDRVKSAVDVILDTLNSQIVREFAAEQLTAEDILVLQRLISERVGRSDKAPLEDARREMKNLVAGLFDCF